MDHRRWMLTFAVVTLLCVTCGCMADQVVYVDGQGNELAVDGEGQPILPQAAPDAQEQAPILATAPEPAASPALAPTAVVMPAQRPLPTAALMPTRQPTRSLRPTRAPDYDLPPAGAAPRSPAAMPDLPPARAIPARAISGRTTSGRKASGRTISGPVRPRKVPAAPKVDSSAGLDLPPAGS